MGCIDAADRSSSGPLNAIAERPALLTVNSCLPKSSKLADLSIDHANSVALSKGPSITLWRPSNRGFDREIRVNRVPLREKNVKWVQLTDLEFELIGNRVQVHTTLHALMQPA
jgi:hypothetical protein